MYILVLFNQPCFPDLAKLQPDHPRENFRDNRCRVYKPDALPFWYIITTNNMKAMKGSQTPTQWLTG